MIDICILLVLCKDEKGSNDALHNGSKHKYHVKYCAVMTLFCTTNINVCKNNANDKFVGAIYKLETNNKINCGNNKAFPMNCITNAGARSMDSVGAAVAVATGRLLVS